MRLSSCPNLHTCTVGCTIAPLHRSTARLPHGSETSSSSAWTVNVPGCLVAALSLPLVPQAALSSGLVDVVLIPEASCGGCTCGDTRGCKGSNVQPRVRRANAARCRPAPSFPQKCRRRHRRHRHPSLRPPGDLQPGQSDGPHGKDPCRAGARGGVHGRGGRPGAAAAAQGPAGMCLPSRPAARPPRATCLLPLLASWTGTTLLSVPLLPPPLQERFPQCSREMFAKVGGGCPPA